MLNNADTSSVTGSYSSSFVIGESQVFSVRTISKMKLYK